MGRIAQRYGSFIKIMKKEIVRKIRRITILTLPIWGILLVNILTSMHLKHFCLIKWLTNHECWGCGLTRAFSALSRFDFQGAYNYNPRIVFFAPAAVLIWGLMLYFEFKKDHNS